MATLRFAAGALLAGVGLTLWGCGNHRDYQLYQTECPKEGQEGCTFSVACDDPRPRNHLSSACAGTFGHWGNGHWLNLTCQEFNDFLERFDGKDNMECFNTSMCCYANNPRIGDYPEREACDVQWAECFRSVVNVSSRAQDHYNKKMDYSKEVNVTSLALDHFNKKMDYNTEVNV